MTTFDKIVRLNRKLNEYPYRDPNPRKYRYQNTDLSQLKNGGMCWEYVNAVYQWFQSVHPEIPCEAWYYEEVFDGTSPDHTFLIFQLTGKWFWFESSWKPQTGIHVYQSKEELLLSIIIKLHKDWSRNGRLYKRFLTQYIPTIPQYQNMNMTAFINTMRDQSMIHYSPTFSENEYLSDTALIDQTYVVEGTDGIKNVVVKMKGSSSWKRYRSEVLIVKGDYIYIGFKNNGKYIFPGGGAEPGETGEETVIRETEEEARIKVKNPKYVLSYQKDFSHRPKWMRERIPKEYWWDGYFCNLYIGEYDGVFNGYVSPEDRTNLAHTGRFIHINKIWMQLRPIHQIALWEYMKTKYK